MGRITLSRSFVFCLLTLGLLVTAFAPPAVADTSRRTRDTERNRAFASTAGVDAVESLSAPARRDCDAIKQNQYDSKADWMNARLDCKNENLHAELYDLVDQSTEPGVEIFSEEQKDRLRQARERAERSRERTRDSGSFKKMGRTQRVDCYIVELDTGAGLGEGDDDGVCEKVRGKWELCLGDNDTVCDLNDKKNKGTCVTECGDASTVDVDDDNFDADAAADVEEVLDDVTGALRTTGDNLKARVRLMRLAATVEAGDGDDRCEDLLAWERHHSYEDLRNMTYAHIAADSAHSICDSGCNQDFFGNNCSGACVGLAIAAGVVDMHAEQFELQDDAVTGMRVDTVAECLEQTDDQLKAALEKLGDVEAQLADLKEAVEEGFAEVILLLNTPHGQRPEHPTKP